MRWGAIAVAVVLVGCGANSSTSSARADGEFATLEQVVHESVAAILANVTRIDRSGPSPTAQLLVTSVVFDSTETLQPGEALDLLADSGAVAIGLDPDVAAGLPAEGSEVLVLLAGVDPYRPARGFQGVWTLSASGAHNADPARSWPSTEELAGQITAYHWTFEHRNDLPATTSAAVTVLPVLWRLDPDVVPLPSDTTITILATERECAGGSEMGDRLREPIVHYEADEIWFELWVAPHPGEATCPSNPEQRIVVQLPGPVEHRAVRSSG